MERQAQIERENHEIKIKNIKEENIKNENRHKNIMNAKYEELQKKKSTYTKDDTII